MDQTPQPRWEWRAFGAAFDELNPLMPSQFEIAHEIYVLSAASHANVKIRGNGVDVKTLDDTRHGLELWRPSVQLSFPLCHRAIREIYAALQLPIPHALFRPEYNEPEFLTDLLCCTDGVRIAGVNKTCRHAIVDGCIVERAAVVVAGHTVQTAAIESVDAAAVLRLIQRLALDRFDNVNYPGFLKRLLGMRVVAPAPAPSEGARHEEPYLSLARAAIDAAGIDRSRADSRHHR